MTAPRPATQSSTRPTIDDRKIPYPFDPPPKFVTDLVDEKILNEETLKHEKILISFDLVVLNHLLRLRFARRDSCWTTKKYLAGLLGCSVRRIQYALARLSKANVIRQVGLQNSDGDGPANADLDDPRNRTGWRIYFVWLTDPAQLGSGPDRRPPTERKRGEFASLHMPSLEPGFTSPPRQKFASPLEQKFASPPRQKFASNISIERKLDLKTTTTGSSSSSLFLDPLPGDQEIPLIVAELLRERATETSPIASTPVAAPIVPTPAETSNHAELLRERATETSPIASTPVAAPIAPTPAETSNHAEAGLPAAATVAPELVDQALLLILIARFVAAFGKTAQQARAAILGCYQDSSAKAQALGFRFELAWFGSALDDTASAQSAKKIKKTPWLYFLGVLDKYARQGGPDTSPARGSSTSPYEARETLAWLRSLHWDIVPDGKGGCCTSHSCDAVVWDDLPATLKRKLDQQKEAIRKEVLAAAAKVPVENARL